MLLSLNWLAEFIDHGLSTEELAERLTMSGTEVKAIHHIGAEFDRIVVGEVLELNPHPQADRLRLPFVRIDDHTTRQVVCGAANLAVGQKIAFSSVGARLFMDPAQKERQELTAATIRGVESAGMVCSERELGLGTSHKGILVLDPECKVGTPLADALGLLDTIFELEITPNRGDCLSVLGIAREVAALTGKPVHIPDAAGAKKKIRYAELAEVVETWRSGFKGAKPDISITVDTPELCPRFSAVVISGIAPGLSPIYMRWRLINCGVRPISNIVDVTNYVMLELGAPQHAYDRRDISGTAMTVRTARPGELMKTLDGVERRLTGSMVVVSDEAKVLCLAGIMGAENSEIKEDTTDIVLEAAHWDPVNIRHTSTSLAHRTEGGARFEKFVDPDLTLQSFWRSVTLLQSMDAGGEVLGILDLDATSHKARSIALPSSKLEQLLGDSVPKTKAASILRDLGFEVTVPEGKAGKAWMLKVSVPRFRPDVKESADLVEEVARIMTIGAFGTRLPEARFPLETTRYQASLARQTRETMCSLGYAECYSYSLLSEKNLQRMGFDLAPYLRLSNPLADFEYLRSSLLPGLLLAVEKNMTSQDEIRLFEVGTVFLRDEMSETHLPSEPTMLGLLVLSGEGKDGRLWKSGENALREIKTALDSLLKVWGLSDPTWQQSSQVPTATVGSNWLHLGRTAAIVDGAKEIGWAGELHPQKTVFLDLGGRHVCYAEIDLSAIDRDRAVRQFKPFSPYPPVTLDISFVLAFEVQAAAVEKVIRDAGGDIVTSVEVLDVFEKPEFGAGNKSMTWRLTCQSMERTLQDAEAASAHASVVEALVKAFAIQVRQ